MAQPNIFEKLGLTEKVIKLSSTKSAREIMEILKTEDNATISHVTVSKFIKEIRQERQEATKASIAETVTPGLNKDLEFFDEMLDTYRELFRALSGRHPEKNIGLGGEKLADSVKVEPKGLAEVGKEYRATVELKVKIAGGNGALDKLSNEQLIDLITGKA
jgi:histidyl-tRNA synthetase